MPIWGQREMEAPRVIEQNCTLIEKKMRQYKKI